MDEILREKASEIDCTDDQVFFDFDDDHDFEQHADHSISLTDPSHNFKASPGSSEEEGSLTSKKRLPVCMDIAFYVFNR